VIVGSGNIILSNFKVLTVVWRISLCDHFVTMLDYIGKRIIVREPDGIAYLFLVKVYDVKTEEFRLLGGKRYESRSLKSLDFYVKDGKLTTRTVT